MDDLHLEIRSDPALVAGVRADVNLWAHRLPASQRRALILAISEVVTNSIRHGPVGGTVAIHVRRTGDAVRAEVRDTGHGARVAPRAPDDRGGRGLHILTSITSRWGVEASPTRVWFVIDG